jgi:hypothetical protein
MNDQVYSVEVAEVTSLHFHSASRPDINSVVVVPTAIAFVRLLGGG